MREFRRALDETLQEAIALGQRVQAWQVDAEMDGGWKRLAAGIGYTRIVRCERVRTSRLRVSITQARACPAISTVSVYDSVSARP